MPPSTNVGTNMKNLQAAKKNPALSSVPSLAAKRPHNQMVAIALNEARSKGANIPKPGASFPHPFGGRSV